ncbi:MAG: CvpA family protein [Desulfovibrio sp.]
MNFLDIILITVFAVFAFRGFFRGLVTEVVSLASIIFGILGASLLGPLLEPHLAIYISNPGAVAVASYIAVFIGIAIGIRILGKIVKTMLDMALLGWIDHGAGVLFGAVEGAVMCLFILFCLTAMNEDARYLTESQLAAQAKPAVEYIGQLTPESLQDTLLRNGMDLPLPSPDDGEGIIDEIFKGKSE